MTDKVRGWHAPDGHNGGRGEIVTNLVDDQKIVAAARALIEVVIVDGIDLDDETPDGWQRKLHDPVTGEAIALGRALADLGRQIEEQGAARVVTKEELVRVAKITGLTIEADTLQRALEVALP